MSQLVKKLTLTVIAVALLLSMSASAQDAAKDVSLMPKAAKPAKGSAGGGSTNYMTHRFEISFQGGTSVGGNVGRPDFGTCKETVTGGCDANLPLGHRATGTGGVYPGRMGGLRPFQTEGGVAPGNGNLFGIRIGFNVTPNWQVEGIWNHSRNDVAFTNEFQLRQAIAGFNSAGFGSGALEVAADGKPQGDQNMFLFNLNRNFNSGGRVQPYAGFGLGGVSWTGNPNTVMFLRGVGNNAPNGPGDALFAKSAGSGTGFAWDFAAGARMYLTERFGVRADFMNVMSYPSLTNRSTTIDLSGLLGTGGNTLVPLSNTREQSGRFNQMLFTGGIFWAFGGAMEAPHNGSMSSGDRDSMHDRWEISLNFGAVHGVDTGKSDVKCTGATVATGTDGCDLSQPLDTDSGNGVFPTKTAGSLSTFLARGGVKPGDGWTGGLRLGFNFTPHWQVNFQWNADGTGTRFENEQQLDAAVASFYSSSDRVIRTLTLNRDGRPQGNQSLYLVNIDYSFSPNNRLVPYIGAGIGGQNWFAGPNANLTTDNSAGGGGIANFSKVSGSSNGVAFNLEAGLKYYLARHWGVRTDFQDVISRHDFTHTFQTVDVNDFLGFGAGSIVPVSGTLKQSATFNQIRGTVGVFLTF